MKKIGMQKPNSLAEMAAQLLARVAPITKSLVFLLKNKAAFQTIILISLGITFSLLVAFLVNKVSF